MSTTTRRPKQRRFDSLLADEGKAHARYRHRRSQPELDLTMPDECRIVLDGWRKLAAENVSRPELEPRLGELERTKLTAVLASAGLIITVLRSQGKAIGNTHATNLQRWRAAGHSGEVRLPPNSDRIWERLKADVECVVIQTLASRWHRDGVGATAARGAVEHRQRC